MSHSKISRRQFLGALSLGTAHLLLGPKIMAADRANLNPYQLVNLGKSGIRTSMLGFGTGVKATGRQAFLTRQDHARSVALLRYAYERGCRFYDTADLYGTHQLMAEAMKPMNREELTVSTKIWFRNGGIPETERFGADVLIDRFRRELGTDYIDMVQLHCATKSDWDIQLAPQMDILSDLKSKGVIRAHGVSVHSLDAMKTAVRSPWVDVIHVRINPYGVMMDKSDPQEVVDVLKELHQSGKGVIGMKLVGEGRFRDDSEKINNTLKFVLGLGTVDMAVVGFENGNQVDDYAARMRKSLNFLKTV